LEIRSRWKKELLKEKKVPPGKRDSQMGEDAMRRENEENVE